MTNRTVIDFALWTLCRIVASLALIVGSGCAIAYRDESGAMHAIGLLDVTTRAPNIESAVAGDVVEVTTVGLALLRSDDGDRLTLGYNRQASARLKDNVFVIGNPVKALQPRSAP